MLLWKLSIAAPDITEGHSAMRKIYREQDLVREISLRNQKIEDLERVVKRLALSLHAIATTDFFEDENGFDYPLARSFVSIAKAALEDVGLPPDEGDVPTQSENGAGEERG